MKWWQIRRKWRCPHVTVLGIYGDAINWNRGYRLECDDCGRYLDGPVQIAVDRWRIIEESRK